GNYHTGFGDVQANLNWDISKKWSISALGYGSWNRYSLAPESRETKFGTLQQSYLLKIFFEGQEVTKYNNYLGSITATYRPNKNTRLRFLTTAYQSVESETFDLLGEYWIGLVNNDMGSETFGDVLQSEGVGSYLDHARNTINSIVANLEHLGSHKVGRSFLEWGAKYQYEDVIDYTNEWEMVDSAGFTLPMSSDSVGYVNPNTQTYNPLLLQNVIKSDYHLISHRWSGFLQNSWDWEDKGVTLTIGGRLHYWDVNKQLIFSPRANVSYKPEWKQDMLFRFSTGYYFQPPTYKELKNLKGELNTDVKAQESVHFVLGYDWNFKIRKRPFKFVTELYYKYLNQLNPYVIDNVSIRYMGDNLAKGFTYGVDFKINGEFVSGTESWITLSFMRSMEDIRGDEYYKYTYLNGEGAEVSFGSTDIVTIDSVKIDPGFIPRPSDQRINFNLFFQDYIPGLPTWKVFINLVFGTGLPASPPNANRGEYLFRMNGYKRVDIGFSKQLISEAAVFSPKNPLRWLHSAWISLEVFNLFNFSNEISYTWVKDVNNTTYAVPNYLTPRQINLRLSVKF
ncbi:MAG: TonB-dependent receptor, partial [Bacteroidales bacterium]|nr:TonB-dependent receptor [Bacteroidales bacterium]